MIEVNHLVKRYGNHKAVDDLSFKVEKGQIYGFLGPNGAGKSTTMNIMTGYIGATSGEVLINGHDILKEPEEAKKCIGYLPEIPPLYMDMTVSEYLEFVAELKKIPNKDRKGQIQRVAALTKLEDMMPRLIKNLSKGYKQRVGLAQAILGFPPIIILDEPTVGLDPKQIIEIRDLIKQLAKEHTIILSSHILQEVSAVCDHIMIISHGRLVASDTPENLEQMMHQDNTLEMEVKGTQAEIRDVVLSVRSDAVIDNVSSEVLNYGEKMSVGFSNVKTGVSADNRQAVFSCGVLVESKLANGKGEEVSFRKITFDYTGIFSVINAEEKEITKDDILTLFDEGASYIATSYIKDIVKNISNLDYRMPLNVNVPQFPNGLK